MDECVWPDCCAPLGDGDIDEKGRCRYCFGEQAVTVDQMLEHYQDEIDGMNNNPELNKQYPNVKPMAEKMIKYLNAKFRPIKS